MTLHDDLVERYSRQILLPEIGGRGQERLLASRVVVTGDGPAAAFAASLLAAAGVGVTCDEGAPAMLMVTAAENGTVVARVRRNVAVVATLVGHPCVRCVPDAVWNVSARDGTPDADAASAQVVAAVVATETLRVILGLANAGRVQEIDLTRGIFGGRTLPAGHGCAACGGPP